MKSNLAAAVVLAALLPCTAGAVDLTSSMSGSVTYDPNVFRSRTAPEDDFIFRLTPKVRLSERLERLKYDLDYGVPLERGIKTNTNLEFDHSPRLSAEYLFTEATRLSMREQLRYSEIRDQNNRQVQDEDTGDILTVSERDRVTVIQNSLSFNLTHDISPRLSTSLGLRHSLFDSDDPERSDNQTIGINSGVRYRFSARHSFSSGAGYTRQMFDDREGFPGSTTQFYSANFAWTYQIDETTRLTVRASPTFVMSEQDRPEPSLTAPLIPLVEIDDFRGFNRFNPLTGAPETGVAPPGSLIYTPINSCPLADGSTPVLGRNGFCGSVLLLNDDPNNPVNPTVPTLAQEQAGIDAINAENQPVMLTYVENPQSNKSSTFQLYGGVSLTKRWNPSLQSAFNYTRRESSASGLGGSTTLDSVSLTTAWRIDDHWSLSGRGDWTARKSIFAQARNFQAVELDPNLAALGFSVARRIEGAGGLVSTTVDDNVDTERWSIGATLTRKLGHNLLTRLSAHYNQQTSTRGSSGVTSDFDGYLIRLTFTYEFRPIRLWH